jgi:hypothetical protein
LDMPGVDLRLESNRIPGRIKAIARLPIPKPLKPGHYVGTLRARRTAPGNGPPMVAVLTALVLCYEEILTQHYLRDSD